MLKFCFQLRPINDIRPWHSADGSSPTLSWFGLTDGWFWIEADGHELFRYSGEILDQWRREYPESPPSELPCDDYQIARSWEDLLSMLPAILDPIPDDLAALVADSENGSVWDDVTESWREAQADSGSWDVYHCAVSWWWRRRWDAGYLVNPPDFWIWRTGNYVHIRWDNSEITSNGIAVWAATQGEVRVAADAFLASVESFHKRFIGEMAERVAAIAGSAGIAGVTVNLDALVREQTDRSTWLEPAVNPWAAEARREYSWDDVRNAIAKIGS